MADYIRVPPDSTGKRVFSPEYTIGGETTNVQAITQVGFNQPENGQYVDNQGAAFIRFAEGKPIMDAYNSLKIVNNFVVGVYEFSTGGYDELFFDYTSTGGEIEHLPSSSSVLLSTTNQQYSTAERTSNRYHYYQPGCPLLVLISCSVGDYGKAGNKRAMGYFDDSDGWFFELDGTNIYVVQRSSASGSIIEQKIAQADWNVDKLDGTGLSGVEIDPTTLYTFWIDITWPVGSVRFGIFSPMGERVVCHEIRNSGADVVPSTRTASLPIRVRNSNSALTASGSEINFIFAAVLSQGESGYTFWRYGGMNTPLKSITSDNLPVLSARSKMLLPNGEINRVNVYPETLSLYVTGGPVMIKMVNHSEADTLLTGDTWTIDNWSTIEGDHESTAISDEGDSYWVEGSWYFDEGVYNLCLTPYYELNDEGILLGGDGATRGLLTFTATKLNPADTVSVSMDLSTRELW